MCPFQAHSQVCDFTNTIRRAHIIHFPSNFVSLIRLQLSFFPRKFSLLRAAGLYFALLLRREVQSCLSTCIGSRRRGAIRHAPRTPSATFNISPLLLTPNHESSVLQCRTPGRLARSCRTCPGASSFLALGSAKQPQHAT